MQSICRLLNFKHLEYRTNILKVIECIIGIHGDHDT